MRRSLLCLSGIVLATVLVLGQAVGRIHGIVRDTSGAVLPGVTVTLTSGDGFTKSTVTDGGGQYHFADLLPGEYSISFVLEGFTPFTRRVVATLEPRTVDAKLAVGELTEAVTVTGSAPVAETQQTFVRRLFGRRGDRRLDRSSNVGPFNTEAYDKVDDNEWFSVATKPLSTFSVDVDTAAYANIRRFLSDGQLPPKDAVRIEEMINYFSYDYPAPDRDAPFSVTTAVGDAPWQQGHRLVLIGLQARRLDLSRTPPRNLVFLVDVSGSMQDPNKLPLVKASLAMLARNVRPIDRVAIVVYAGAAGVVLPSTSGEDVGAILGALSRLEAGGSTDGADGIVAAYGIAREHFIRDGVNRVVLATDGDFNVGVTDRGALVRLIEENRESGITLTVLGYGMGNLKDATLEQLADRGNGNYAYIDSLAEARKVLVDEAAGTLVTVAKDVKLQVEFNPRFVSRYRLIGYENRQLEDRDFNDDAKDAGDMGAGHSVTALYEIVPVPHRRKKAEPPDVDPLRYQTPRDLARAAASDEMMTVKVRHKRPDGKKSTLTSVAVSSHASPSRALGFAAAVAEFGMVLRDSPFKGESSLRHARELAEQNLGAEPGEHRRELVRLLEIAEKLRVD